MKEITLMKRAVLIIALVIVSIGATPQPQTKSTTWEYKVENGVSEGKINSLASQGWEVVTASNYNGGMPYVILRRSK